MCGNGGKRPSESEAVRQEDIRSFFSELLPVVRLSEHDVTDGGFDGRNQHITCFPATSGDMPAAFLDEFLHLFILFGIVFLHPRILHSPFKVENVFGIFL